MKRLIAYGLALLCILNSAHAESLTLILDKSNNDKSLPSRFRTTQDEVDEDINLTGFREMVIAGGSQFSASQLSTVLATLHTKKLIVVDLREESHAFINGSSVSWFGFNDAPNKGKTPSTIEADQRGRLLALSKFKKVSVTIVLKKRNETIIKEDKLILPARDLLSEAELVKRFKLNYQRFYVTDHYRPSNREINRFIHFVKTAPRDHWIYFHCEAGRGRTTTFMVLYDILHNAKDVPLEDILTRQDAIGGKNFAKQLEGNHSIYPSDKNRIGFIKDFYQYVRENNDNFTTPWSQWIRNKTRAYKEQANAKSLSKTPKNHISPRSTKSLDPR